MGLLILRGSSGGGGGSSEGFTPQAGFTVVASSFAHGEAMTVTRSSGSWATRTYGNNAWLYDIGDKAWQNGTEKTPMSIYSDGDTVAQSPSNAVWTAYGTAGTHPIKLARSSGSRTAPNSRTSAWWYSTTGASNMKTELMQPIWPSAWNGGTQNNQRIYASWWFRMKNAYAGGDQYRGKYMRYNATDGSGVGSHQMNPDSLQQAPQTMFDTGPPSLGSTWYRVEFYGDLASDAADGYIRYRYVRQIQSTGTSKGPHEFRSETPYNSSTATGGYLYTSNTALGGSGNVPFTAGWSNITLGAVGYDGQAENNHAGQEHDVANLYVDANWERFEISDNATWSLAPNSFGSTSTGTPREIQGRWSRDSSTQCTVYINQGQFASLSGKYLWYVDDLKTATLIGQFS